MTGMCFRNMIFSIYLKLMTGISFRNMILSMVAIPFSLIAGLTVFVISLRLVAGISFRHLS